MFKRGLLLAGAIVTCLNMTAWNVSGMDVYPDNIPDETFRAILFSSFDLNGDGILSTEECNDVSEIVVDDYGVIESVEGIGFFPNLRRFMCDSNRISYINVAQNSELEVLTFNHNYVSSIDLRYNPDLAELYCRDNNLTTLDLSANPKLGFLDCRDNPLTVLDVSRNPELTMLKTDLKGSSVIEEFEEIPVPEYGAGDINVPGTESDSYIEMYRHLLEQGEYSYTDSYGSDFTIELNEFALLDVDQDGYDELITRKDIRSSYVFFAFDGTEISRIFAQSTFQGTPIGYDTETRTIGFPLSMTVGTDARGYFQMDGLGKYKFTVCQQKHDGINFSYYIDDRAVTQEEMDSLEAQLYDNAGALGIRFYSNNSQNRSEMEQLSYLE